MTSHRFDERDTMFARMARRPDTPAHADYYSRRSDLQRIDDHLRSLPPLLQPGGSHYDPAVTREAESYFEAIPKIQIDDTLVEQWSAVLDRADTPTTAIKRLFLALGAVAVGCTKLSDDFVYTHKGRFDDVYGRRIDLDHDSVIVFLVEMGFEAMQRAPRAEAIRESARQYFEAARISMIAEAVLKARGHEARAHYDAHYDLILPPLAVSAGLGELGRHNILIADRYGTRVRIGAVSTNLPLVHDSPIGLGADHFCQLCRKCAENCPSRALSEGEKEELRGVWKWPTHVERCYGYWRNVGTDCGICMAVCPFSHRDNWFHNLVRGLIKRAPWSHRLALLCDDALYGRHWRR